MISGVAGMSNMGGISSYTGQRQGERGAIVMGGVRDVRGGKLNSSDFATRMRGAAAPTSASSSA